MCEAGGKEREGDSDRPRGRVGGGVFAGVGLLTGIT